jgi:very-short-patch-repair endonuclease
MRRLTPLVRTLRRNATPAERALWRALRETPLPCRVRRQHPIGDRVVDFAFPSRGLAVNLGGSDGDSRDIESRGYRLIRFADSDVWHDLQGVIARIIQEIGGTPDPAVYPPSRRDLVFEKTDEGVFVVAHENEHHGREAEGPDDHLDGDLQGQADEEDRQRRHQAGKQT